ncbi:MAG TPA: BatA domain-containing protein [Bacteroidia bacterium]|nr:BatA domain-containing protein [Bacteroidia bacterium]HNU32735.1 BatA domain-containing protein [Bacteroidia bacterium]
MALQFLSPSFLWCLLLVSIPIIIHLFNFRRFKKVLFTNVKFLKELKEETNSRSRLKHLLVLLMRILAVAFLVFAFAQPFIPAQKQTMAVGQNVISIYLDNSFSMMSESEEGNLLELAKNKATEITNAFPASTQFQILTNEFAGVQQRLLSKEEAEDEIAKTKISPNSRTFNDVIARQQEMFSASNIVDKRIYYISDFQKSVLPESLRSDTTINLNLVALKSNSAANVYIDSCWLSSPVVMQNEQVVLTVMFKNSGDEAVDNIPVKLAVNGLQKAVATVAVAAQGEASAVLTFNVTQPGWQQAQISITDNPVTFDDDYYFSFKVADKIDVYHIAGGSNIYLNTLFANNAIFNYTTATQQSVDYSQMQGNSTVVISDIENITSGLADELKKFIQKGGSLVLFPDSTSDIQSYNNFLSSAGADVFTDVNRNITKIDKLDLENNVFKSVFEKQELDMNLPGVSSYYNLALSSRNTRQVLMRMQGGSPFLCEYSLGSGKMFLFTTPANSNQSGFVKHALFVPILTRIVFLSTPSGELSYTIGNVTDFPLTQSIASSEAALHLINSEKNIDVIPQVKNTPESSTVIIGNEINIAGYYQLQNQNKTIQTIAMNYNRTESALNFFNEANLGSVINASMFKSVNILSGNTPSLTKSIKEQSQGIALWKYCIILVLVFLGFEVLLLRFMK